MDAKSILIEILEYFIKKIKEDKCTMEEIDSVIDVCMEELSVYGTAEDFAEFYKQTEANVRNVMSRRPIPRNKKPKRRVLYNFQWFNKIIPSSWHKK